MKTLREKIAVMQAAVDGAKIQYRDISYLHKADYWHDARTPPNLSWDWRQYDYRVKPEPRVIYVNEYEHGLYVYHYSSKEDAEKSHAIDRTDFLRTVKFVEDIDE